MIVITFVNHYFSDWDAWLPVVAQQMFIFQDGCVPHNYNYGPALKEEVDFSAFNVNFNKQLFILDELCIRVVKSQTRRPYFEEAVCLLVDIPGLDSNEPQQPLKHCLVNQMSSVSHVTDMLCIEL